MALSRKGLKEISQDDIDTGLKVKFHSMDAPDSPEWMAKEIKRLNDRVEVLEKINKDQKESFTSEIEIWKQKAKKRKWQLRAAELSNL